MPDDIRELRHPDFYGLQLGEQPVTQGARIARNVDTWKYGLLSKRPGLRRMNHRQYLGQIVAIADLQRICDYGKFLILSGLETGGEIFEHQQTWADPTPPGFAGAGPWGGGGGGGSGGSLGPGGDPPEPPFNENWPPVLAISADVEQGCVPLTVQFSSAGSWDPDGAVLSYFWQFGDGDTSTDANPLHTYATDGSYTATLRVTDDEGAMETGTIAITVFPVEFEWFTFSGTAPAGATIDPSRVIFNYVNREYAVIYCRGDLPPDNNLYIRIFDANGVTIVPETVIANNFLKSCGWAAAFDGEQYGIIYGDNGAIRAPFFCRVNANGVVTVPGFLIEPGIAPGLQAEEPWGLSWNGTHYLAVYQGTGQAVRIARLTNVGVISAAQDVPVSWNREWADVDSDGADWLIVYHTAALGPAGVRHVTAGGALGAAQTFPIVAGTVFGLRWCGTRYGVGYNHGVTGAVLRRYLANGAPDGGELVIGALPATFWGLARRASGWCYGITPAGGVNPQFIRRLTVDTAALGADLPTGHASDHGEGTVSATGTAFAIGENPAIGPAEIGIGSCLGD